VGDARRRAELRGRAGCASRLSSADHPVRPAGRQTTALPTVANLFVGGPARQPTRCGAARHVLASSPAAPRRHSSLAEPGSWYARSPGWWCGPRRLDPSLGRIRPGGGRWTRCRARTLGRRRHHRAGYPRTRRPQVWPRAMSRPPSAGCDRGHQPRDALDRVAVLRRPFSTAQRLEEAKMSRLNFVPIEAPRSRHAYKAACL
jgi:hypothetical protein